MRMALYSTADISFSELLPSEGKERERERQDQRSALQGLISGTYECEEPITPKWGALFWGSF